MTCVFLEEMLEGTFEERVKQLVRHGRDDPVWARDLMISLVGKLRERTGLAKDNPDYLNPTSFGNYFKPVKKLFDMNDVTINWKRVYVTYPELDNMPDTAGWTREEIARMIRCTRSQMDRALVLVLASSGVRSGALAPLKLGRPDAGLPRGRQAYAGSGREGGRVGMRRPGGLPGDLWRVTLPS